MESLLFLSHRIPYPPNKGDKVRSYHLLKHLSGRYRVCLGTFVDDPADWQYLENLRPYCAELFASRIRPTWARLRSLSALATGEALTLRYYRDEALGEWVDTMVKAHRIARAFIFSSAMAQYAARVPGLRTVLDLVDVDSSKWGEYASRRGWPSSWIYRREASKLLDFERAAAARADATILVTAAEAALFRELAPETAGKVRVIPNGVDTTYFSPDHAFSSPFTAEERPIVLTGAMDYWPNVDAVCWFAREVLPMIRAKEPRARFYIVGMNPASAVRALSQDSSVVVTGAVEDVRPFLQHAEVVVAPLRIARGVQNKALEAMAMGRPLVISTLAASALSAHPGHELEVATDAAEFAERVLGLLASTRGVELGRSARKWVLEHNDWARNLAQLDELIEGRRSIRTAAEAAIPDASARLSAPA